MDLSRRLNFLFGSDEHVGMRRQLVSIREKLWDYHNREFQIRYICSGSLGEGVAYPKSDDDMLFHLTYYGVVNTFREATHTRNLLMVPSEICPGYCLLHLYMKGSQYDNKIFMINGMPFVSSTLWKQAFLLEGDFIHGPCQSGNVGEEEYDFAFSIKCYTWPNIAHNWIIRNRSHSWPSREIIGKIVKDGCHVVPVGDPDSPNSQHEWRISFSVAERTLMHSLNHAQFLIYNLLRLTLKSIIGRRVPDVLCSYFMKTTLFYLTENTPAEMWRVDNLETCFRSCLSVLHDYVYHKYCPSFFIPGYNMLKRKVNQTNRSQLLDIIEFVYSISIVEVIHLSGESSCLCEGLSEQWIEYELDEEFMYSNHLRRVLDLIDDFYNSVPYGDLGYCLLPLHTIWCVLGRSRITIDNELQNVMLHRGMINSFHHMIHRLCKSTTLNKQDYCLHKRLQSMLSLGCHGDETRGKLTMATYMYIVGKTKSAVITIRHLLSHFPTFPHDCHNLELKMTSYVDAMCGKGYSIGYKMKRSHVPPYTFSRHIMNAYPFPLRIWVSINECLHLDPLTYAFFLQGLCCIQQHNLSLLRNSIRYLRNLMYDLKHEKYIADAAICVGILKYVEGDSRSAIRWLGSVILMTEINPPSLIMKNLLSVLTYISCVLHRYFLSDLPSNRFR